MNFNKHSAFEGMHATLSPSNYHWLNYDAEKMETVFRNRQAVEYGTRLHALAKEHIELKIRMPRNSATFNSFVNDAIGYRMTPEQVLFYSVNCFGTADAISFNERKNILRIHDLKTGVIPASMKQLYIYAALFCLEYNMRPGELTTILRIYQNDEIVEEEAELDQVAHTIDKIVTLDKLLQRLKEE